MSDSSIASKLFGTVQEAGKGFVKGTAEEVQKSVNQGIEQITGSPSQNTLGEVAASKIAESSETPARIELIRKKLLQESHVTHSSNEMVQSISPESQNKPGKTIHPELNNHPRKIPKLVQQTVGKSNRRDIKGAAS